MILSIIIPVYNEEKTIAKLLNKVLKVKLPKGMKKEIIIIDDGSTDKTKKVLSEFKIKNLKLKIFRHKKNLGKGAAVRNGIRRCSGDLVIIQDADLEYDPKYYGRLIKPIIDNEHQAVFGNRFNNYSLKFWGQNKTILPVHWIANKFLSLLVNLLYGSKIRDMETCYKVFNKKVLANIELKSNRFNIEPEITAKILKNGIQIKELPIMIKPRTYKEGKKISWKDGIIALWTIVYYRFFD